MLKTSTIVCILLVMLGLSMQNCNVINPKETTPTYIHIDSFRTPPGFSHKITAVWAYYNNSPVGVFDLPATFPVMAKGTGKLVLAPGVAVDGQNSQMTNYPFYTLDTSLTINEQPGKIITYQPFTEYYSTLNVVEISNFEAGTKFSKAGGNVVMQTGGADSLKFEGLYGAIYLNAIGDSSIDSSISSFTIPAGQSAFIEFNYRTTIPFQLGLEGILPGGFSSGVYYKAGVKPNDQWQKFYLNVQDLATKYSGGTFKFYIKADLANGQASGRMLIDNIKLITF